VNGVAYGDSTPHSELKAKISASDGPERDLVTIMAVCHTVVPETLENGSIAYRAESPDEEDLAATISGMDSPGRLGVQDSDQAQAAVRYNRDQAAEKSFYAPKTPNMPKKNVSA